MHMREEEKNKLFKKRLNQLFKQPIMINGHICTSLSVLVHISTKVAMFLL